MRKRRPLRRKKLTVIAAVILTAALLTVSAVRAEKAAAPSAKMQAEQLARHTAGEIISGAVADYLDKNQFTACDFAAVLYDENGKPVSVEAIPFTINKAQAELTMLINHRLEDCGTASARIPLGSLYGSYLLAGRGPELKVRICPVGDVSVQLRSSFTSAGINQTCHRIYAEISVSMSAAMPLYSYTAQESFQFLIAESVLIGETPDISPYLSS